MRTVIVLGVLLGVVAFAIYKSGKMAGIRTAQDRLDNVANTAADLPRVFRQMADDSEGTEAERFPDFCADVFRLMQGNTRVDWSKMPGVGKGK